MSEPLWFTQARAYIGLREIPGPKHNPTILKWWEAIKAPFRDDETSWCGGFVGGVLAESGLPVVKGAPAARSWLNYGEPFSKPVLGCMVVFWRGSKTGWFGHVGFLVGLDKAGNLMVLGRNQGDMVSAAQALAIATIDAQSAKLIDLQRKLSDEADYDPGSIRSSINVEPAPKPQLAQADTALTKDCSDPVVIPKGSKLEKLWLQDRLSVVECKTGKREPKTFVPRLMGIKK